MGTLIGNCSGTADIHQVTVNCGDKKDAPGTMFFDAPMLISVGKEVRLYDIRIADVVVSQYENAAGLVGQCEDLSIDGLSIEASTVQSKCGYLVTDASLIVRTADQIRMSDVSVLNTTVTAIHYASGCALECRKIDVSDVKYVNSTVEVFRNDTLPGIASKLVVRENEELAAENFDDSTLTLINEAE